MGVTYAAIDQYIKTGQANDHDKAIIGTMPANINGETPYVIRIESYKWVLPPPRSFGGGSLLLRALRMYRKTHQRTRRIRYYIVMSLMGISISVI